MAVAIDATGTETLSAAGISSPFNNTGLTVGTGLSNGGIIVFVQADSIVTGIAVKWAAQTLGLISSRSTSSSKIAYLFGGVAPTSGNQTIAVSWSSGTHQLAVCGMSLTGVNQTGGTTTFAHATTNGAANSQGTIAVTSAVGNMTVASWVQAGADSFSSTSATQIYVDNGGAVFDCGANRAAGAATVTMTATFSDSSHTYDVVACDIVAAAVAAFTYFDLVQPDMAGLLRRAEMVGY